MPLLGYNIGKESQLDLVDPELGIIPLALVIGWNPRALTTRLVSAPITNNGERVYRILHDGWEGTFEVDRANGVVDALFQLLEDGYFAGQPQRYFLLTQTITNPDGSLDQFRFRGVVIVPEDSGNWRGEEKVTQRFMFIATKRDKV